MSHQGGERPDAGFAAGAPSVMTFGAVAVGDLLAGRYRLDEHVDTDSAGRQIWRGMDTVLRRPVALVIRQPGGESAAGMLTTAVAASRLVHPHIVSVYDAFDEGHRAYLVREWVPGVSLRDVLRQAPLDAERTTLVVHAIAEAVAALHAAGIVHGNVHPGTILVADDGRVVLTDTHADGHADAGSDVRALGAVLYACLTSHWPYAEAGHSTLPDAVRDSAGRLASPRQVRGGIPRYLDDVATELLDPRTPPPAAATLAAEFARLATQGTDADYEESAGPMGFGGGDGHGRRRAGGKLALGVAVLAAIAVTGALAGVRLLGGSPNAGETTPAAVTSPSSPTSTNQPGPAIKIDPSRVRIVDPPRGDGKELDGAALAVDGHPNTGWSTDNYNQPYFGGSKPGGGIKPGMGVLIDLGQPTKVGAVRVDVNQPGASISLRSGQSDPGAGATGGNQARAADGQVVKEYTPFGSALEDFTGVSMVLAPASDDAVQYLLIWVTKLPPKGDRYSLTINEITVYASA